MSRRDSQSCAHRFGARDVTAQTRSWIEGRQGVSRMGRHRISLPASATSCAPAAMSPQNLPTSSYDKPPPGSTVVDSIKFEKFEKRLGLSRLRRLRLGSPRIVN